MCVDRTPGSSRPHGQLTYWKRLIQIDKKRTLWADSHASSPKQCAEPSCSTHSRVLSSAAFIPSYWRAGVVSNQSVPGTVNHGLRRCWSARHWRAVDRTPAAMLRRPRHAPRNSKFESETTVGAGTLWSILPSSGLTWVGAQWPHVHWLHGSQNSSLQTGPATAYITE